MLKFFNILLLISLCQFLRAEEISRQIDMATLLGMPIITSGMHSQHK